MTRSQIAVLLALAVGEARAADVSVTSTTLVGGRPDVIDGQVKTVAPLYELVGVRAKNLELKGFDELGVAVDAWGGLTLPNSSASDLGASDVNLAFVEGKTFDKRLRLRLGRQFATGGVARASWFDGLYADYRSKLGVGLSAFAGIPVDRRFSNLTRGDFVFGTRAYWAPSVDAELGASFIDQLNRGVVSRQDVGFDGRWRPHRTVTLSGAVVWSIADLRLAEFDAGPRWQPIDELELLLTYRRTAPDLFLPRTSIFTVFADTTRDDAGLSVSYQATRMISLFGDARALWINGESGYDAGLRMAIRPFRSPATSLSAQLHRLSIPSNGTWQGRIAARHTLPSGFALSADVEAYLLDQAIRNETKSLSASVTGTLTLGQHWLLGLTLFTASTPTWQQRFEVVAKLSWMIPSEGH